MMPNGAQRGVSVNFKIKIWLLDKKTISLNEFFIANKLI